MKFIMLNHETHAVDTRVIINVSQIVCIYPLVNQEEVKIPGC